jgi:Flp pilus assembly protein TadG
MTRHRNLLADRKGSAAVEMALSLPILLVLAFGSLEVGNYFLSEHVVDKAVRDASRYAARLAVTNYPSCTSVNSTAEQQIKNVARTGDPAGTNPRLWGWADGNTTVSVSCDNVSSYGTGGIYTDFPNGAPVVTVTATVPYTTFFGSMGLGAPTFSLYAQNQAAVIGA